MSPRLRLLPGLLRTLLRPALLVVLVTLLIMFGLPAVLVSAAP
ncbi:MAG TPA: hypothetical protein VFK38_03025 [Candidatus Limnocylindrales bacterium]|nr:hypothetical protein [Candidatus Limnocylindrales bacterium]